MILSIEIFINVEDYSSELGKLIRKINAVSFSEIKANIYNGLPLFSCSLDNEKFYVGIDDVLLIVDFLDLTKITYWIKNNGEKIDRYFLDQIKLKLSNISLQDIR